MYITTISTGGNYNNVLANSNLTCNPSTSVMTVNGNLNVSGTLSGTTTN